MTKEEEIQALTQLLNDLQARKDKESHPMGIMCLTEAISSLKACISALQWDLGRTKQIKN